MGDKNTMRTIADGVQGLVREVRKLPVKSFVACAMLGVALLCSAVPAARAQGSRKDDIVFNAQGRPMAGANVRVCTAAATGQPCAPLANIYSDAAMTQAMANPFASDGLGNYTFYAVPGRYLIEINGPGIVTKQLPNVILPNDPSAPTFTSLTTTSGISAFSLSLSGNLTVNGSTAVTGALMVGGAPVPSTAQANTWSATQTFNQDIIYGTTTPWTDVRSRAAVCNGTSNDTAGFTNTLTAITYPTGVGGTVFLPHNCSISPATNLPWNQYVHNTIGLGGLLNLNSTLNLASGTTLKCLSPASFSPNPDTFTGDNTCTVKGGASVNTLVNIQFRDGATASNWLSDLSLVGADHHEGVPLTLVHSDVGSVGLVLNNVNVIGTQNGDLPCDFEGFWMFMHGGGCLNSDDSTQAALRVNNHSGTTGGFWADNGKVGSKGMLFTWKTPSTGTTGGLYTLRNMIQENVHGPVMTVNTWGGSTAGIILENVLQADTGEHFPIVETVSDHSYCMTCASDGILTAQYIVNPSPTWSMFHTAAVLEGDGRHTYADTQQGAVVIGLPGNKLWGAYGSGSNYIKLDANQHSGAVLNTSYGGSFPALVAQGHGTSIANPYQLTCIASGSGGTIPAGTYYLNAAHTGTAFDGSTAEGFLGESIYVTTTGTTSSIACSWVMRAGAAGTRIYMGTQDLTWDHYYTASGLANTLTITSLTGTAGTPFAANPSTQYLALNSFDNPNGSSWLGMGGNVCVGLATLSCPSKLYANGTFQATGPVTFGNTVAATGVVSSAAGFSGPGFSARRSCTILITGSGTAGVLQDGDFGSTLDGQDCFINSAATVMEITVRSDAGTPNVIVGRNRVGTVVNLTSSALATAAAGAQACSAAAATTGIDGVNTCSATLQNASLAAGDWLGVVSGTAGGTAKRMSIAITYVVN